VDGYHRFPPFDFRFAVCSSALRSSSVSFSTLEQIGDNALRGAAEQTEDFVEDAAVCGLPRDRGLKEKGVADLARTLDRSLLFQTADDRLHRRVGRPGAIRRSPPALP